MRPDGAALLLAAAELGGAGHGVVGVVEAGDVEGLVVVAEDDTLIAALRSWICLAAENSNARPE